MAEKKNKFQEHACSGMFRPLHKQDTAIVISSTGRGSLITEEMRAQGMNLMDNLLRELANRDLKELKTKEIIDYVIKITGMFVSKEKPTGQSERNVGSAEVIDVLSKIGTV